jgi:hypothetical protein
MPNLAYIEDGSLTVNKLEDGQIVDSKQAEKGDSIPELENTIHYGESGPDGVVMLVWYAGAKDLEWSTYTDK